MFQAEDDEDEQMDQDEEPQMQVVLHEVQVSLNQMAVIVLIWCLGLCHAACSPYFLSGGCKCKTCCVVLGQKLKNLSPLQVK